MKEPAILQNSTAIPVTAIIPVYQTAYLEFIECLNSIAKQTRIPERIIVVDDGNNNSAYRYIVADFAAKLINKSSVECIILPENHGISFARNTGLWQVKTPWVSFIDSDDKLKENFFERLYEEVEHNESIDIICCGCDAFDGHNYYQNHFYLGNKTFKGDMLVELEKMLMDNKYARQNTRCDTAIGVPWGKLYKVSCISVKFDQNLKRMEDNIWNHQIIKSNPELVVKYIDEPLYIYRTTHIVKYNDEYEEDISTWLYAMKQRKSILKNDLLQNSELTSLYYDEVGRLLMYVVRKKFFHKDNPNRKASNKELRAILNQKDIQIALDKSFEGTPIYRNTRNRFLRKGHFKLAYILHVIRPTITRLKAKAD